MTDDRYSRHVFLKEIGPEGQSRIAASRVFIIGAGGVGCPAALALVESGVASLTIADADAVDLSNLPRQILHTPSIPTFRSKSSGTSLTKPNSSISPETATSSLTLRTTSARATPPTARPKRCERC